MKVCTRRLLALVLALAMALSLLSVSVWAAQEEDDGDKGGSPADVDSVTEMTETVDGFVWSLTGGTLTVTGSGTLSTTPDWAYNAVMSKLVLGSGISGVGDGLFYDFAGLKEVSASSSLTSIGDTAFCNCTSLTSVDLGSVSSIGESAFQGCTSLKSVDLPSSLTSIGGFAFAGCSSLTSADLPSRVSSIGDSAFTESGLTSVGLPSSVSYVGESAFENCTSLRSLSVSGNPNFDTGAFNGCSSLKSVDLGSNLTTLGEEMFYDCTSLSDITLPESVTQIGSEAFYGCTGLKSLHLGKTVTSIGEDAFCQDDGDDNAVPLAGFSIEGSAGSYAEQYAKENDITFVALGGKKLKIVSVTLSPEKVEANGQEQKPEVTALDEDGNVVPENLYSVSFSKTPKDAGKYTVTVTAKGENCEGSATATFEITAPAKKEGDDSQMTSMDQAQVKNKTATVSGVATIAAGAFQSETGKKVTTVILGGSVKKVQKGAFTGAKNLKKLNIKSKKMTIDKNAFKGLTTNKIKINVTKKMSTKNFKMLVKQLRKAGIPKKNIKQSVKF